MSRGPVDVTEGSPRRRRGSARRRRWLVIVVAVCVMLLTGAGAMASSPAAPSAGGGCPALWALGVQGTGQSAPDAAPTTDTGMLSEVFRPMLAQAGAAKVSIARAYVPYDASFGGFTLGGGSTPYAQSVQNGLSALTTTITRIAAKCGQTRFALAGYSQGAHVVSLAAQAIGQGHGAIPADKIAAVALFGDPTRHSGAATFPGDGGRRTPDRVPGTSGSAVAGVAPLTAIQTAGGGIGPERDQAVDFGALTGRVADFCIDGDLACAAPDHAPVLRAVANVAGQAQYNGDPIKALASVTQALALTGIKAATNVINNDVSGDSLATLDISPRMSLSERVAQASDPRIPVDGGQVLKALFKFGTIALNSVMAFVQTVLTPENITEIATAGLANPVAGLATFGEKLLGALPVLMPPATGSRLVQEVFQTVVSNLGDNRDLLSAATWTHYSDVIVRHGSYAADPIAGGKPPTAYAADWFTAAAKDITATTGTVGSGAAGSIDPGSGPTTHTSPAPLLSGTPTTSTAEPNGLSDLTVPEPTTSDPTPPTTTTTSPPATTTPTTTTPRTN